MVLVRRIIARGPARNETKMRWIVAILPNSGFKNEPRCAADIIRSNQARWTDHNKQGIEFRLQSGCSSMKSSPLLLGGKLFRSNNKKNNKECANPFDSIWRLAYAIVEKESCNLYSVQL